MLSHWKHWLEQRFADRREQRLWRERAVLASPQAAKIIVNGRELINFCSNDYLGLATHQSLREAAIKAIEQWGCGSGASHLVCGHSELHERLELELAQFVGAETAVLCSTGYMANLAVPQTLLSKEDLLVADRLNHASLIDAAEMVKFNIQHRRYAHRDVEHAGRLLSAESAGRKMILTDGVFSMDGDLAPLLALSEMAREHQALLVVDDAHGFGVLGTKGAGTLEHFQIPVRENVLMVGTLGKAAGSFGAFIAGDRHLIDAIIQFGRTYIYTTALPPAVAATTLAALDIFRKEPERRDRLFENVRLFRQCAQEQGMELSESQSPIQPFFPSAARNTESATNADRTEAVLRISQRLHQEGFWVSAIRPPTVPIGTDRLRIAISSEHSEQEIRGLVDAISRCEQGIGESVS